MHSGGGTVRGLSPCITTTPLSTVIIIGVTGVGRIRVVIISRSGCGSGCDGGRSADRVAIRGGDW